MKYLHLIWAAMFRSKTRTLLTLLSVIAAFLLFGLLDSVRVAFNAGSGVNGVDRMVVGSKLSITQMLPYSLGPQIETTPGVKQEVYAAWFGGIYKDPRDFFPNFSVGPGYLDMYPEFVMPAAQKKTWEDDRIGAMKFVSSQGGPKVPNDASVTSTVGIGPRAAGGFGLDIDLAVSLPGLARADAEALVEKAHQVCPYSNATRGNVDVRLTVV
jgi:hypothetical protein